MLFWSFIHIIDDGQFGQPKLNDFLQVGNVLILIFDDFTDRSNFVILTRQKLMKCCLGALVFESAVLLLNVEGFHHSLNRQLGKLFGVLVGWSLLSYDTDTIHRGLSNWAMGAQ